VLHVLHTRPFFFDFSFLGGFFARPAREPEV